MTEIWTSRGDLQAFKRSKNICFKFIRACNFGYYPCFSMFGLFELEFKVIAKQKPVFNLSFTLPSHLPSLLPVLLKVFKNWCMIISLLLCVPEVIKLF